MKWMLRVGALALSSMAVLGCRSAPGYPKPEPEVPRPEEVHDFATLYKQNCSGCHGENGRNGAAIALNNPVYLALAGREKLVEISAKGEPGTMMPGFASPAGMLTEQQVESIVDGMIRQWGQANVLAGQNAPAYAAATKGDAEHGQQAFATYCARCHGSDGRGGASNGLKVGSIVDPSYLQLISDQGLRSITIAGRPDEGKPDWRGDVPGHAMSDKDVTDIVAWLAAQRQTIAQPEQGTHGGKEGSK
jgi:mono/diheme cytochrome c family protein